MHGTDVVEQLAIEHDITLIRRRLVRADPVTRAVGARVERKTFGLMLVLARTDIADGPKIRLALDFAFLEATMDALIALCACPDSATADRIARTLVDERLAACVNRLPGVESTYHWNGAVQVDEEVLLAIKTSRARYAALEARIVALHPYEVPEVIAIPIGEGYAPYLAWIAKETRPE
jgi:periplasmic divalent cation tolerance protein